MIYTEFACYDTEYTVEVKDHVFRAIDRGVKGVSVPSIFLSHVKSILSGDITLSCPIDYPDGRDDTKLRNHAVLKAVHKGADAIDLVANLTLFLNGKAKEFADDIKSNIEICKENGASCRVMADYRKIEDGKKYMELWKALVGLGVSFGFVSTGCYVDDCLDNLTLAKRIEEKYGISMICNGNVYLPNHFGLIQQSKAFGVRFHNINAVERCLVGV